MKKVAIVMGSDSDLGVMQKVLAQRGDHGREPRIGAIYSFLQRFGADGICQGDGKAEIVGMMGADQGQKQNGRIVHCKFRSGCLFHKAPREYIFYSIPQKMQLGNDEQKFENNKNTYGVFGFDVLYC